ncbi:PDC sensor domain-containing protein, partial [Sulfurospirillum sp.]|uniref:PDC sensor domain-containing protein n=1 Tax=Sulfurospirillum sp. TaxID=2053622 RepID=UPI002FDE4DCB
MSFKAKIIVTISVLMFLSLGIFSLFSYIDTKKNSVVQIEASLQMASRALTDYIDLWVSSKKSGVAGAARSLSNSHTMDDADLEAKLKEMSKTFDAMESYAGFEDGKMIYGSGKKKADGYDPRARGWYKQAKSEGKVGITDAYVGATAKVLMVTVMAPIMKNGAMIGVVGIDLPLETLVKAVGDVNFNGGYGILLDTKKMIVAHPNKELLGTESTLNKEFKDKKEGFIEYDFQGANKIFAFKVSTETGWTPGITFDKETAYAFLTAQIKDLMLMGLVMLILSIGIMIVLIKA